MKRFFSLLFLATAFTSASGQQALYDVTAGNGNGIRFWQSDTYKIHMGNTAEYQFGPVSDYSIKMNMSVGTPSRGWTWGPVGYAPVAALNTLGNMEIAGRMVVGGAYAVGGVNVVNTNNNANDIYLNSRVIRNESTVYQDGMYINYNSNGSSAAHLRFFANGTNERMRIDANTGNIGIGTTSPLAKLHISSAVARETFRLYTDGNTTNYLSMWQGTGAAGIDPIGTGKLYLGYDQATQVYMGNGTGKVGIGTTNPDGKLEISQAGGQLKLSGGTVAGGVWTSAGDVLYLADWNTGTKGLNINMTSGNIGIGTFTPGSYKLAVEGKIGAREVNVTTNAWSDYVFSADYKLRPLAEVQQFIEENHHLPEVPSEKEVLANGQNLGEMNAILLRKIEELTLYQIQLLQRVEEQSMEITKLKEVVGELKTSKN